MSYALTKRHYPCWGVPAGAHNRGFRFASPPANFWQALRASEQAPNYPLKIAKSFEIPLKRLQERLLPFNRWFSTLLSCAPG